MTNVLVLKDPAERCLYCARPARETRSAIYSHYSIGKSTIIHKSTSIHGLNNETLKFEIFWREAATWQVGSLTTCLWVQLCIGHYGVSRGQCRVVKGIGYLSVMLSRKYEGHQR